MSTLVRRIARFRRSMMTRNRHWSGRLRRGRLSAEAVSAVSKAVVVLALLLSACAPPPKPSESPKPAEAVTTRLCLPHDLTVEGRASHTARIAWNPGCSEVRILRGFNIYLSTAPLAAKFPGPDLPDTILSFNREVYPGDTLGNPDRETYTLDSIPNAIRFFIHARAVNIDNTLSLPTNEVQLICYPQGVIELEESFSGRRDGFSFSEENYCRTDALANDLYFYHRNGDDFLCSPSRLGPVNRPTKIYDAGEGIPLAELDALAPIGSPLEKILIRVGTNLVIITADGRPAALHVTGTGVENDKHKVVIEYLFKP